MFKPGLKICKEMLEIISDMLIWILYHVVLAHIRSHHSLFIKALDDRELTIS